MPEAIIAAPVVSCALQRTHAVLNGQYSSGRKPWRIWNDEKSFAIQKIDQVHITDNVLYDLVTSKQIGEWAARVTGAKTIQLWATQLLHKPPHSDTAGNVGWHTDHQYWNYWQGEVFTAWLPLNDITLQNGALRYVVGSHCWQSLPFMGDAYHQHMETLPALVNALANDAVTSKLLNGQQWQEEWMLIPAGGLSLHHGNTLHGSGPNYSDKARTCIAIHLRTEKSQPVFNREHQGFLDHLDDPTICPILIRE